MKINLENMKEIADKLDRSNATLEKSAITVDDVCSMAYQLQYFFEAMEAIDKEWEKDGGTDYRYGLLKALRSLEYALIDKEE